MKNRTIIGIVCMILAVAMTFAIAPVVNRLTSDTTTVVRLKQEVGRGTKITEDQVETVKVKTDTMPQGVYVNTADVVGKYASTPEIFLQRQSCRETPIMQMMCLQRLTAAR